MIKKLTLLFALSFLSLASLNANDCIPKPQTPPRLVNDFAGILSTSIANQLETRLVVFNDTTSTQIAIVTVNSLCDYDASSFAFELGEKWGVGNAKFDNGIVMLIKPKVGNSKGHAFIATGYGLEGVLPDAIAKRIVENEMIPYFKRNDYEGGVLNGLQAIIDITGGEYSAENYNSRNKRSKSIPIFPFLFILLFIFIMLLGTIKRARGYSRRNNTSLWLALWLMGSSTNRHKGYYDNFGNGGGGFGGFGGGSGGGFGGFGGGSFGGGGAGGSW